ncbi:hypothetical protein GC173_13905, partial [bacterium]|nr:hypothetical protein [bacterium]
MKRRNLAFSAAGILMVGIAGAMPPPLPPDYTRPTEDIEAMAAHQAARKSKTTPVRKSTSPTVSPEFISFAYLQNDDVIFHTRWQSLTHISSLFVVFDANGNFTNRGTRWDGRAPQLAAGGDAEAAGVKVVMVVNCFDDAPGGAIE